MVRRNATPTTRTTNLIGSRVISSEFREIVNEHDSYRFGYRGLEACMALSCILELVFFFNYIKIEGDMESLMTLLLVRSSVYPWICSGVHRRVQKGDESSSGYRLLFVYHAFVIGLAARLWWATSPNHCCGVSVVGLLFHAAYTGIARILYDRENSEYFKRFKRLALNDASNTFAKLCAEYEQTHARSSRWIRTTDCLLKCMQTALQHHNPRSP